LEISGLGVRSWIVTGLFLEKKEEDEESKDDMLARKVILPLYMKSWLICNGGLPGIRTAVGYSASERPSTGEDLSGRRFALTSLRISTLQG
jgi:hypothetical protein